MLENETRLIIETLSERTIGRRDAITLKEVVTADLPKNIKVYIRSEVIRWLRADLLHSERFGRVNMNAPGIAQLTLAFLRSLSDGYHFNRTEYLAVLADAVEFVQQYLCRPQWALQNLVFESEQQVSLEDLLMSLQYTSDYSYFPRLIEKVLRQWNVREVSAEDFRLLVARIDRQIVKQHTARELGMLTKPIYDFLVLGDAGTTHAVPLDPLLLFFEDKGMRSLRDHIVGICGIRGRSELTIRELTGLIEDLYLEPDAKDIPQTGDTAPSKAQPIEDAVAPADALHGKPAVLETPPDATDQAIRQALSAPEEPPPNIAVGTPAASVLADLNTLMGKKNRQRFLRRLFRRDTEYFEALVSELNAIESWKDASAYLTRVYEVNRLDPFAEEVVEFTDLIQSRYSGTSS